MREEEQEGGVSQKESQQENRELKVELQLKEFARLSQLATATGVSLEQLVARELARLVE